MDLEQRRQWAFRHPWIAAGIMSLVMSVSVVGLVLAPAVSLGVLAICVGVSFLVCWVLIARRVISLRDVYE